MPEGKWTTVHRFLFLKCYLLKIISFSLCLNHDFELVSFIPFPEWLNLWLCWQQDPPENLFALFFSIVHIKWAIWTW